MSEAASSCRPAVAGATDWFTLKLDAGTCRRTIGRQVEEAHGFAIEPTLILPAE